MSRSLPATARARLRALLPGTPGFIARAIADRFGKLKQTVLWNRGRRGQYRGRSRRQIRSRRLTLLVTEHNGRSSEPLQEAAVRYEQH